jgi:hypothetical protein
MALQLGIAHLDQTFTGPLSKDQTGASQVKAIALRGADISALRGNRRAHEPALFAFDLMDRTHRRVLANALAVLWVSLDICS